MCQDVPAVLFKVEQKIEIRNQLQPRQNVFMGITVSLVLMHYYNPIEMLAEVSISSEVFPLCFDQVSTFMAQFECLALTVTVSR